MFLPNTALPFRNTVRMLWDMQTHSHHFSVPSWPTGHPPPKPQRNGAHWSAEVIHQALNPGDFRNSASGSPPEGWVAKYWVPWLECLNMGCKVIAALSCVAATLL